MKAKKTIALTLTSIMILSNLNVCFAEAKPGKVLIPSEDNVVSEAAIAANIAESSIDFIYPVEGGNIYFDASTGKIFDADKSITAANIPSKIGGIKVTTIGDRAFDRCLDLKKVTLPNTLSSIEHAAFVDCKSLTTIKIPESITTIEGSVFNHCEALESISLPTTLTKIVGSAFGHCVSLKDIYIPNGVTYIGKRTFENCVSLTNITIPNSVSAIELDAFKDCTSLKKIIIPRSVNNISVNMNWFSGCDPNLLTVYVEGNSFALEVARNNGFKYVIMDTIYPVEGGSIYFDKESGTICAADEDITTANIPSEIEGTPVTAIGEEAFGNCLNLSQLTLPDSLITIGHAAFRDCRSLTTVKIPEGITTLEGSLFNHCYALESVSLPSTLTEIIGSAFEDCTSLKDINIPYGVTYIGKKTFDFCESLTSLTIPDSVDTIASNAFSNCTSLSKIVIPKSVTDMADVNMTYEYNWFNGCDPDLLVVYVEDNSLALDIAKQNGFKYVIYNNKGYSISKYYPQDNTISIGTRGDAKVYFVVNKDGHPVNEENVNYSITIGNTTKEKSGITSKNGLIFARLDNNRKIQNVKIKLLIDETKEHGTCELDYKIVPEELSYTTVFEGSLKAAAKASAGLSKSIGPMELSVASAGVSVGNSKSLSVSYIQKNEQEKNTTDVNVSLTYNPVKVSANGNLGLNAKIGNASIGYDLVDAKAGAGIIKGYELTLKDYFNKNNANYEKNMIYVILSLIDGALMNSTGMVSVGLTKLNDILMDKVLNDELKENASSKNGYALDYNVSSGAKIKAGNAELSLDALGVEGVLEFTNKEKGDNSSAKEYKNTAEVSAGKFGFGVSGSIGENKSISTDLAEITPVDYEAERSLTAEYNNNNELNKLYYKTEYPTKNHKENLLFLEATKHNSLEYEVDGTLLNKIKNDNNNINEFVTDPLKTTVNGDTIDNFPGILDNYDEYSKYADNISEEKQIKIPISIDVGDGIKLGLDMEIQGKEAESYKTSDGVYNKDGFLETSIYDDYGWTKNYTATSFLKPAEDVIKKFTSGIVDKFNSAVDKAASFVDEVADGLASLSKKINNDLTLTLSVIRDPQRKSSSYNVMSYDGSKKIKLIDGNVADTDIEISKVLSDTYVVNVTDVNGEYVYDFSDSPMILTIPYNDDMVAEAGGIENMAIYKWDGEAGLYEKYNGTVNETEKNITAEIYYSGEYMLCADNTKPSISNFIYDAEDSALKADIKSKLSIIDEETLTLLIDGTEIPDVKNGAYESASGKFTYQLNLAAGTHTAVLSVKDSKGSLSDAAMLTFTVENGTAPGIAKGDVNGDNIIDSRDSLILIKYIAGDAVTVDESLVDFNKDNIVDSRDSLILFKYVAGDNVALE